MAFCKFSSELIINNSTSIDNIFICEYLPFLSSDAVKVYVYGMFVCGGGSGNETENTLENFCKNIKLKEDDVRIALAELEAEGLISVLNLDVFEIRFLPIKNVINNIRKFNKSKYAKFNTAIQDIIEGRMLTPNEFAEYYTVIEAFKMEPDALLLIAKYATMLKGKNVGHSYITTIAKNWAYEGLTTTESVNEKLLDMEKSSGSMKEVLNALKIFRTASFEERKEYLKWKKDFKFKDDLILFVANNLKSNKSFSSLSRAITKYDALNLRSEKEIAAYEKDRNQILKTAKTVVRELGLYYESLEAVIENYINVWLNKGFSEEILVNLAKMCFKQNVRTLEGMNAKVNAFFKKGIISEEAFSEYSEEVILKDEKIKKVLDAAEIVREVNNFDRSLFNTWTKSWNLTEDLILYAATLAKNSLNAFSYINKILENWKDKKITTVEEAKKVEKPLVTVKKEKTIEKQNFAKHDYSNVNLNALFANLDEVLGDE